MSALCPHNTIPWGTLPQTDCSQYRKTAGALAVSELLQFIIVVAFGAFCFGRGSIIAFIVTRNKYRNEMSAVSLATISRPANGNWGSRQRNRGHGK